MSSPEKGFDSKNKKYLQSSASKGCAGIACQSLINLYSKNCAENDLRPDLSLK